MKLLEYEAKRILKKSGVPVPASTIIKPDTDVTSINTPVVVKSQVPVGGRGKAGGVQIVTDASTLLQVVGDLFNLAIKGHTPTVLLGEEVLDIKNEHYLALLIDRSTATIQLMAHKNGGIDVESNDHADFFSQPIDTGTITVCSDKLAAYLGYDTELLEPLVRQLFDAFTANDTTLLEINPLAFTNQHTFICGDCKMELDDAAVFRHPEWQFSDTPKDTNFVTLDTKGTIGTIANGAGLAMATVDAVAAKGMKPANFLDIGGGATTDTILAAFRRMDAFPHLTAIVINIFAGITRCDEVARAIIAAKQQIPSLPPLYIRLAGTNFEQAVTLLYHAKITTLPTLEDCLNAAKETQ